MFRDEVADHLDWPGTNGPPLLSLCRRAMACDFEIQLPTAKKDNASEAAIAALDLIDTLEDQLTVYRDESELIDINQRAASESVEVEPRLFELLQMADRLFRETGGAIDITSGPLSQVWGFSQREGRVPTDNELQEARQAVGWQHVQLTPQDCTIEFSNKQVELNVNAIGKGYALDRAGELLEAKGVKSFLVQGGRSSVLVRGNCPGEEKPECGWSIGLRNPLRPEERLGTFVLRSQSLGTSGSATQFFEQNGKRYGHLIDPRTGEPTAGVLTATVVAPTAAEADGLSTAFYIMGLDATKAYCQLHPEISAALVCPKDENSPDVSLYLFGFDRSTWRAN